MVNKPYCIDIYQGDNVSDNPTPLAGFDQVRAAGIAFLFHKASEGAGYRDMRYGPRRVAWMASGSIAVTDVDGTVLSLRPRFGAYHFFHGVDIANEARTFLTAAALTDADAACCDWENVGKSGYSPPAAACDEFCSRVEDAIGRTCWVYGGNVPREQLSGRLPSAMLERFAARNFWFCEYGSRITGIPLPWAKTGPTLWQDDGDTYGPGPHRIPGITTLCDNSTVVGAMTVAKLDRVWAGTPKAAA